MEQPTDQGLSVRPTALRKLNSMEVAKLAPTAPSGVLVGNDQNSFDPSDLVYSCIGICNPKIRILCHFEG